MFKVYDVFFLVTLCEVLTYFTHNSSVFDFIFEQLNICWIGGERDSEWQDFQKLLKLCWNIFLVESIFSNLTLRTFINKT